VLDAWSLELGAWSLELPTDPAGVLGAWCLELATVMTALPGSPPVSRDIAYAIFYNSLDV